MAWLHWKVAWVGRVRVTAGFEALWFWETRLKPQYTPTSLYFFSKAREQGLWILLSIPQKVHLVLLDLITFAYLKI